MDERIQALEIFAEQIIAWAEYSIEEGDEDVKFSRAIIEFAESLGLPV